MNAHLMTTLRCKRETQITEGEKHETTRGNMFCVTNNKRHKQRRFKRMDKDNRTRTHNKGVSDKLRKNKTATN